MRGAPRKKASNSWVLIKNYFHKNKKPGNWTLTFRFILIPAFLLFLVFLTVSIFFSRSIRLSSQEHLTRHLHLAQTLLDTQLREKFRFLDHTVLKSARNSGLIKAFQNKSAADVLEFLEKELSPIKEVSGFSSLNYCVYLSVDESAPNAGWACPERDDIILPFLEKTWQTLEPVEEIYVGRLGLSRVLLVPVVKDLECVGLFGVRVLLGPLVSRLDLPAGMSMVPVVKSSYRDNPSTSLVREDIHEWTAYDASHVFTLLPENPLTQKNRISMEEHNSFLFYPFVNYTGRVMGGIIIGIDHSLITSHNQAYWRYITIATLVFSVFIVWILYYNLYKVKLFLNKLKKMIVASHSNDFSERFETDPVHCLDVMNCHNEECPVYENPSLVCYLETGSQAISPKWRDTCIFLNKYEDCSACPVYILRKGDELDEMRNVINTMMRLWSVFLDKSGRLLNQVLRSDDSSIRVPSLDDVASRMEQMARLTSFGHDIRGVYQKEEVYEQLKNVFKSHFRIDHFILFEVNPSQNRMNPVLDSHPQDDLCKKDVILNPEICRAKRMSEEVSSRSNEALCPYFNCDLTSYVRCCIPLVMGGQVGTVFSFMVPRAEWALRREQVAILRKYMEETAPILTTLRLLEVTREQSMRDPLTHCQNRRFLDEYMQQYEPLCIREGKTMGFLMADLDFFKQVNDQHGHQAGDLMLKQVVSIIREGIRSSDLLIRYGGEEFLVMLPQVEPGMSEAVAEKLRSKVEQFTFDIGNGKSIQKTISIGVAEFPHDANSMYKAIKFSDVALYEAKKKGRNRVIRFTGEMWTDDDY